jgi:hypothetical protein
MISKDCKYRLIRDVMMRSMTVAQAIPDVEVFLALEPEELGAKLLFMIRNRFGDKMFYPDGFESELWEAEMRREITYPRQKQAAIRSMGMAGSPRPYRASRTGKRAQRLQSPESSRQTVRERV